MCLPLQAYLWGTLHSLLVFDLLNALELKNGSLVFAAM